MVPRDVAPNPHRELEPNALEVRGQVEKVLSSGIFAASERMCRFLRFAVERSLEGRGAELKEYLLGVEIFDRSASFDPRVDPIVRVEARRLRSKLRSYYETQGRDDGLIIEFPTGTYAPRIRRRGAADKGAPGEQPAGNIAVLPFANLSPDPDSEYFSDGLTEELIHALTRVEGLRVVAWNSAARLKDTQQELATIGRQLKVPTVLMGSVRKSGDRLRILAQLVDTASGHYLWSETYDRRTEDLFAIQEEISRAIVSSLRIQLLGPAAARVGRTTWNLEAYDLYLRGRFHWNRRVREGLQLAIQYFTQAISVDPHFAPGHAGLADAYSLLADHGLSLPGEVMPKARAAALRALELAPDLAEAHTSLGIIQSLYDWEWRQAGEHYRRAIELNPGYATGRHWYACDYLALLGRFDEALSEMEVAVRLDPLSPVMNESQAYILLLARRYDEALEQHVATLEFHPHFFKSYTAMGRVYLQKRMYAQAIEMLQKGRSLAGDVPNILGALGQAYALDGQPEKARALLAQLTEMAQHRFVPWTAVALIHAGLGEVERGLDWLERACDRRDSQVSALKVHPAYDALRPSPRFAALLKRIGLDT